GLEDRAAVAALEGLGAAVQAQAGAVLVGAVAGQAGPGEEGLDVALEVDGARRHGGQPARVAGGLLVGRRRGPAEQAAHRRGGARHCRQALSAGRAEGRIELAYRIREPEPTRFFPTAPGPSVLARKDPGKIARPRAVANAGQQTPTTVPALPRRRRSAVACRG